MFKKNKKDKIVAAPSEPDLMEDWMEANDELDEGYLSIDVYQSGDNIIVKSTIAGARPEDLEVSVNGDVLSIKGERHLDETIDYNDYIYRECYWGKFSRTVILPTAVDETKVEAGLENGILTIVLPKLDLSQAQAAKIKIKS